MKIKVIDGDTFDADLNRDQRITKSRERIRLLYVDTPELSKSHKGKNLKSGLPAKDFLISALSGSKQKLWVDPLNRTGNHGRLLGVLESNGRNQNLALIYHGHSYFDTRYAWPDGFETYAKAEKHAFEKQLGIWNSRASRKHYLLRLRKEGKTVYSTRNPFFITKIQKASSIDLPKFKGRFIRIRGVINKVKKLRKGAKLIYLKHQKKKKGIPVITFENQRNNQHLDGVKKGDFLQVEGFSEQYKKRTWQVKMHRAFLLK